MPLIKKPIPEKKPLVNDETIVRMFAVVVAVVVAVCFITLLLAQFFKQ